jgi:hypothetical protein
MGAREPIIQGLVGEQLGRAIRWDGLGRLEDLGRWETTH